MKIIQLTAENVKKLKVVDITPTKDFIQITGKNGSGKTSVLDSIWWALAGADAIQEQPIRKGQEKAIIKLNLGDMIVTRKFTKSGTTLSIENAEGFKAPSPQAMLDAIIGNLTFDPLEFSRMPAKEQFDALRRIADVKINFDDLAKSDKADTEKRRDINRDIKNLEGELASITVSDDAPTEFVNVGDLIKQLGDTEDRNAVLREREIEKENSQLKIKRMEERIEEIKDELVRLDGDIMLEKAKIEALPLIVYESTDPIKARIASAETINKSHAAKQRRSEINAQVALKTKASDELTKSIATRAENRLKAIQASKMPIVGLTLGEGDVLFNDIPFLQLSAAEQLRVSVAIAMAANPKLKIIRIKDGSLLDDDSLKMIQEMSAAKEYQVWIENVDTTGKVGIYMEDGEIKENNYDA